MFINGRKLGVFNFIKFYWDWKEPEISKNYRYINTSVGSIRLDPPYWTYPIGVAELTDKSGFAVIKVSRLIEESDSDINVLDTKSEIAFKGTKAECWSTVNFLAGPFKGFKVNENHYIRNISDINDLFKLDPKSTKEIHTEKIGDNVIHYFQSNPIESSKMSAVISILEQRKKLQVTARLIYRANSKLTDSFVESKSYLTGRRK